MNNVYKFVKEIHDPEKEDLFFPAIFEHASDIIVTLTSEGNIADLNGSAETYYKCKRRNVIGKDYAFLLRASNKEMIYPLKNHRFLGIGLKDIEPNFPLIEDGIIEWHVIDLISSKNRTLGFVVIGKRKTSKDADKVTHKDEDQQIQNYLEYISSCVPGNFYWKNKEGYYQGCNNSLLQTVGFASRADIVGKTDYDLWPLHAEELRGNDKKVMSSKETIYLQESVDFGIGEMYYTVIKMPLLDREGNVVGIIGNSLDITELKQTQKKLAEQVQKTEQANYSKLEFISTASHEIRNPMTNVIALQEIILGELDKLQDIFYDKILDTINEAGKTEVSTQVAQIFREITAQYSDFQAEGKRTLNALQNLGDLHRMQLDGIKTNYMLVEIKDILEKAISNSTYPNLEKMKIELLISTRTPREAVVDYANVCSAVRILVGNAVRFSYAKGRIKINVDVMQKNRMDYLAITIQDFGMGMPEEQVKHLFSTLFGDKKSNRESVYRKPSVQLSQAKMWIEASGGSLEIKSSIHQGTTAYLTVPYHLKETVHSLDGMPQADIHPPYSVLVIEDDIIIQRMISNTLTDLGHTVETVSNGLAALTLALKNNYDVVLLDISLPDINGLEVMRQVREQRQDEMIFVCLTSHTSEDDEDYFISQGAMAVLGKPVATEDLKILFVKLSKLKHL